MVGKPSDSVINNVPAVNTQELNNQAELSQHVQSLSLPTDSLNVSSNVSLGRTGSPTEIHQSATQPIATADQQAAPTSKWDKFVDVTEQGIKDIPAGIVHTLQNPAGLLENAAVSVAMGTAAKVLLPEAGPLGSLFAVGLGAYFTEQSAVPIYDAYKTGLNAKTMGEINDAGGQLGNALGGMAVNLPIGIYGYKLGAGLGDSIMASPKMDDFVQAKADFYNPINNALNSGIESGKSALAGLLGKGQASADSAVASPAAAASADDAQAQMAARVEQVKPVNSTGSVSETSSDAASGSQPPLPDKYQATQEKFGGKTVTGISKAYLNNLENDPDGNYYGAGSRYPDVMQDPQMAAYLKGQNAATMGAIDKDVYSSELANEAKSGGGFGQLPKGWDDGSGKSLSAIDVTDEGSGTMDFAGKSYSLDNGDGLRADGQTIVPASKSFIPQQVVGVDANGTAKLAVVGSNDGASALNVYDQSGHLQTQVALPGFGTLHDVKAGASPSQIQFLYDTPVSAPQALTLDLATNKSSLAPVAGFDFNTDSQFVTDKVTVPYTDRLGKAQSLPMYVSHAKDMAMDGSAPGKVDVYGGFDVGEQYLRYLPSTASWLEKGGVAVAPVLPGDGGLGDVNYQEGLGQGIQNTDLAISAAIEKLHDLGYTSPAKTGIYGRSNGGMIVNTMLNNHPNLLGAAVTESGVDSLFDSPKINVDTGAYWKDEFGDPSNSTQAAWMAKLDPMTNLSKNTQYPPTLVEIGTKDGIVNVGNGITLADLRQKMGNGETRLFTRYDEGHDPTSLAVQTAFLWDRLTKSSGTGKLPTSPSAMASAAAPAATKA